MKPKWQKLASQGYPFKYIFVAGFRKPLHFQAFLHFLMQ